MLFRSSLSLISEFPVSLSLFSAVFGCSFLFLLAARLALLAFQLSFVFALFSLGVFSVLFSFNASFLAFCALAMAFNGTTSPESEELAGFDEGNASIQLSVTMPFFAQTFGQSCTRCFIPQSLHPLIKGGIFGTGLNSLLGLGQSFTQ